MDQNKNIIKENIVRDMAMIKMKQDRFILRNVSMTGMWSYILYDTKRTTPGKWKNSYPVYIANMNIWYKMNS